MSQIFRTFHRFLTELSEIIPELKPAIDIHLSKSSLPKEDDELLGKFLESLTKYDEELASRDDAMFQECLLLGDLFLGPYWKHLSDTTKNTIWKYLSLLVLGGGKYFSKKAGTGTGTETGTETGKEKENERVPSSGSKSETKDGVDGIVNEKLLREILSNKEFQEKILGNLKDLQKATTTDLSGEGVEDYMKKMFGDASGSLFEKPPMEILKTMIGVDDIEGTEIGKLFTTVLNDLSGAINPDDFGLGLSQEDMLKQSPEDILGLLMKKGFSSKIMNTFSGLEKSVNERIKKGDLDPKKLLEQSQSLMSSMIPKLGPVMGDMLTKMMDTKTGNHKASTKARLQQKLEARRQASTSASTSGGSQGGSTGGSGGVSKKKKRGGK
jgi:hypothetical protein